MDNFVKTDEIRRVFLEFFRSKGHEVVPSDSLVPKDDPTVLFTGAGMNQFKEKFLGRNVTYRRAASCQKCLRTGDLENVGRTTGHHTFFEMLGNFSFGDYFKKEAILWAWEFLTKNLKLTTDNLWASVYNDDDEAYRIWRDVIKLPENKILKFGAKENFWPSEAPAKGPNGPCGPCSEIFYDYGKDAGCLKAGCTPACGCGRFVEVWNLVFTQFDRQPDGNLKSLPSKNIDTGMGLERLASVMQGAKTNFEIDIFKPLVEAVEETARQGSGFRVQGSGIKSKVNAVADHIRAVTFMITDGVMPSNEEHGYVVRKLIRRAIMHGQDLGIKGPFLYKLVSTVGEVMCDAYPEVKEKRDDIAQVVKKEEEAFISVLKNQLPIVDEAYKNIANEKKGVQAIIAGTDSAFIFSDTYGVPYETCEASASTHGITLDKERFEILRNEQREKSRAKTKMKGEIFTETFAKKVASLGLKTEFLGYEASRADAKVVAVLDGGEVILDRTPFYGESGGQVGDWGRIETHSGAMEVEDAKKIGDTIVHIGRILKGRIEKGETARVSIDEDARKKTMANHTATHLLQAALRRVLGEHVKQTGSMVDRDRLRFDFTHMKKMEEREIARVEEIVNEYINKAVPVKKEIKEIEEARREGAIALFGEKYDRKVRVVSVGDASGDVSKELCGGTHVDNTVQIGIFKITSESSIASGLRRIEALTGEAAKEWMREQKIAQTSKLKAQSEKEEEKAAMAGNLRKEIENLDLLIQKGRALGGAKVIIECMPSLNMEALRALSDRIRKKEGSAVIVLSTTKDGKVSFIVSITDDLVGKGLDACALAKDMAKAIDGRGGGRAAFAQGGGREPSRLEAAFKKVFETLKERLR